MQEQRNLCRACEDAVADQHLSQVLRLLRSEQLGMQIRDQGLARQLLKVSEATSLWRSLAGFLLSGSRMTCVLFPLLVAIQPYNAMPSLR